MFDGGRNEMRRITPAVAVVVAASLFGCQREQPVSPKPAVSTPNARTPFLVLTNAGIEHEFYRDLSLDEFLDLLPNNSVDSIDLSFNSTPQVFSLVKVPDEPGRDLTRVRFETTFKTREGQVIEKRWKAAKDRKSGKVSAVSSLPGSVVEGETKVVPSDD
jgi:hypothetical protein